MTLKELLNNKPEYAKYKVGTKIKGDTGTMDTITRRTVLNGELVIATDNDAMRYTPDANGKLLRTNSSADVGSTVKVKKVKATKVVKTVVKRLSKKQMLMNRLVEIKKLVKYAPSEIAEKYVARVVEVEAQLKRMR